MERDQQNLFMIFEVFVYCMYIVARINVDPYERGAPLIKISHVQESSKGICNVCLMLRMNDTVFTSLDEYGCIHRCWAPVTKPWCPHFWAHAPHKSE